MTAPVRAVLWDADGVLQQGPPQWDRVLTTSIGEESAGRFARAVWERLDGALAGTVDMVEHVETTIRELGLDQHREEVLASWELIDPLPDSLAVLADVRRSVPCYLATNQDTLRMSAMRRTMGYDALLDGAFYSCEVGAAKPDPAYFERVAERLDLAPGELLFVDDLTENVEAARAVGLRAEQWHFTDGVGALRARLAAHGL